MPVDLFLYLQKANWRNRQQNSTTNIPSTEKDSSCHSSFRKMCAYWTIPCLELYSTLILFVFLLELHLTKSEALLDKAPTGESSNTITEVITCKMRAELQNLHRSNLNHSYV